MNNKFMFSPSPFDLKALAMAAGRQGARETAAPPIVERRVKGYNIFARQPCVSGCFDFLLLDIRGIDNEHRRRARHQHQI